MQFEFTDVGLWRGSSHGFSCEHQQLSNSMDSSSDEAWLQVQAARRTVDVSLVASAEAGSNSSLSDEDRSEDWLRNTSSIAARAAAAAAKRRPTFRFRLPGMLVPSGQNRIHLQLQKMATKTVRTQHEIQHER